MTDKRIILVTTIHNRAKYLPQCLDSALSSTLDKKHWVHLLIDNASTDGATQIAREYCDQHDHMYLIPNETNIGQMPAYNFALKWVKEQFPEITYMAMTDSDDTIGKFALETCFNLLNENPQIDITYSDFNMIGAKGELLLKRHPKSARRVPVDIELTDAGQKLYRQIQIHPKNGNIATHFRFIRISGLLEKMGRFREDYEYSTDFCIYCDALGCGMRLVKVDKILYNWRNHKKGKNGSTGQVEKDHGDIQSKQYHLLREMYEKDWRERGLI